jgi:hypothetical protein
MVTAICDLKRLHHRLPAYVQARLASVVAMFNTLLIKSTPKLILSQ